LELQLVKRMDELAARRLRWGHGMVVIARLPDLNSNFGGPGGIRTPDLLNAIQTRSQLRHGPMPDGGKGYPAGGRGSLAAGDEAQHRSGEQAEHQ
jgi:hypothetical protein